MNVPPIISYAQNFEDVMLWRALGHVKNGFYIDVGAQDPVVDSVSLAFYEHGWRGVHIEPAHHYAALLRQHRPEETVLETAVGAEAGIIRFYEIPDSGISTADQGIAEKHRERGFNIVEINVPCVTLASVFKSCARKDVHWLKIDVEGLEEQVLAGWKPSKVRPWVVVVESTLPLTQVESYESWEPLLLSYGYSYVYFDGLNRFYVSNAKKELKRIFQAPPNVFDGFSISDSSSASVHRVLVERYNKQIENLNATVIEHASRERAAIESTKVIKSGALEELARSLLDYEAREIASTAKSEAREREILNIFAVSQKESARRLESMDQQSIADRSDVVTARERINDLQQLLAVREREFAEQLARARMEVDHLLTVTRAEFESRSRELISAIECEAAQREELLRQQIEALRVEREVFVRRLAETDRAYAEQLAVVEKQAQSAFSAQVHAHREREQMLIVQSRRDIEAVQVELKAQLLETVSQERLHSENITRLHEDVRQQLDAQYRFYVERENILRGEFSAQVSSQVDALGQIQSAAQRREDDFRDALSTEKQARELLGFQLGIINLEVAAAHAHEHVLQLDINSRLQQIAAHQAELSFIRDTLSWRLTSPLRYIASWLGRARPDRALLAGQSRSNKNFASDSASGHSFTPPTALFSPNSLDANDIQMHEPVTPLTHFAENNMTNINHVNQLFELYDIAFVRAAYQFLLGRTVDDAGGDFYLTRLRSGIAKADIIFEISQSDEGKRTEANLAGLSEFIAGHLPVRSTGFRGAFMRLTRTEHQANRLENEIALASAVHAEASKAIQDKLQNLENLLHVVIDSNDGRMRQLESALTALHVASSQQLVAKFENQFHSFNNDVGSRLNQVEDSVNGLQDSIAQQANTIIAAHAKSIRTRLDSSVEPPLSYVQKEQLMREIESWTTVGLVDARN